MPDEATPETKLEAALVAYTTAELLPDLAGLNASDLYAGCSCEPISLDSTDRLIFEAGIGGGPLADQGNYETPLTIWVVTRNEPQPGEPLSPLARHTQRVNTLTAAFSEDEKYAVCAELMNIDAELGVNAYWGYDREPQNGAVHLITGLRKTFDVYLV